MATSPVSASVASIEPILKDIYARRAPVLAFDSHPIVGLTSKSTTFLGKRHIQAVRHENGQGRSADFLRAQGNESANKYIDFIITRFSDYFVGSITGEAIEAAKGGDYSMADSLESEISGGFTTIGISLGATFYANGTGLLAQIASGQATNTITLSDVTTAIHFGIGMTVVCSTLNTTAAAVALGAPNPFTAQITAVDYDAGTLTIAGGVWNAQIPGLAANSWLGVDGDVPLVAGTLRKFPGLAGWLPTTAPTAGDSFYLADRSVNPTKLAGIRLPGGGAPKAETWQKATALAKRYSAKIDTGFMNPLDMFALTLGLGSDVRRIRTKASEVPLVGYEGVEVVGPAGNIKIYADPDCPLGIAYALKLDSWEFLTLGKAPKFLELDGNHILRAANADAYEFRIGYRGALVCSEPGHNMVITW